LSALAKNDAAQNAVELAPQWFAAYTMPRHEKRVGEYLCQRAVEHFLPLYHVQRKWRDGSRVTVDLPVFPGYVFVRILRRERVRVLEVPGVLKMVEGTGGKPAALPEAEIEALRAGLCRAEGADSLRRLGRHGRRCAAQEEQPARGADHGHDHAERGRGGGRIGAGDRVVGSRAQPGFDTPGSPSALIQPAAQAASDALGNS